MAMLALALALPACAKKGDPASASTPANWRTMATDADRDRIRQWRQAWTDALPLAQAADPKAMAAEPLLFDPDRALDSAMPPVGQYRCRVFKLGSPKGQDLRDFTAYPPFQCVIDDQGNVRGFSKTTGSQRPTGLLFPDTDARAIFLGTLVLGDETAPLRYGQDANRDMIGYVERIGDKRWRLVLPYPRFESLVDVVDLTPAG